MAGCGRLLPLEQANFDHIRGRAVYEEADVHEYKIHLAARESAPTWWNDGLVLPFVNYMD